MSRPKMTEVHRAQVRNQILDQAYAILVEKGPEHISSRAIAQHLSLTHMGLFTYFPNQAAIFSALIEREQAKLLEQLQAFKHRARNEDIQKVMGNGLAFLQDFAGRDPNLFRLAWFGPGLATEDNPSAWLQPTVDLVAGLIQYGMDQGVFHTGSARVAAQLVIGLVYMPLVMASSGKIFNPEDTDPLKQSALSAAMLYLQPGTETRLKRKRTPPGWFGQLRTWFKKIL